MDTSSSIGSHGTLLNRLVFCSTEQEVHFPLNKPNGPFHVYN